MATPITPSYGLPITFNDTFVGLKSGNRQKPYKDRGIYSRLILGEIFEGIGGWSLTGLAALYNRGGKSEDLAIKALKVAVKILGIPDEAVEEMADEFGGFDKLFAAADDIGTLGMVPDDDTLYIFDDDELNISAGQYSTDSIYQIQNKFYKIQPKREWIGNVDWISGIPNLSWLGEWIETDKPAVENPLSVDHIQPGDFIEIGSSEGSLEGSSEGSSKGFNIAPVILSGLGFVVGGPLGAGIGFLAGQAFSND